MIEWAQFYTPDFQSKKLVEFLPISNVQGDVEKVFDIGAGKGDLLAAASHRWPAAQLYAVDIDKHNILAIRNRFPGVRCLNGDAMHFDLPRKLGIEEGSGDIAVANPPYGQFQTGADVQKILAQVGLDDVVSPKRISRELVFLAQNLRLLKAGGSLVVIIPEGLASGFYYGDLRAALMQRHGLHHAIELPAKTFSGTEAKTLALFLSKGQCCQSLTWVAADGVGTKLTVEQVRKRLDGNFHNFQLTSDITLADLAADVRRGNISFSEGRRLPGAVFHTTEFHKHQSGIVCFGRNKKIIGNQLFAEKGDILLARVGTRCIGKVAWVKSGNAIVTDCVYRIRVPQQWQKQVFESLRSATGSAWLNAIAHGTCAQLISKRDLMNFPVS